VPEGSPVMGRLPAIGNGALLAVGRSAGGGWY
jgi:hypothetical protein